jgi:hypothetical protein
MDVVDTPEILIEPALKFDSLNNIFLFPNLAACALPLVVQLPLVTALLLIVFAFPVTELL